jgi:hypothetical protein
MRHTLDPRCPCEDCSRRTNMFIIAISMLVLAAAGAAWLFLGAQW